MRNKAGRLPLNVALARAAYALACRGRAWRAPYTIWSDSRRAPAAKSAEEHLGCARALLAATPTEALLPALAEAGDVALPLNSVVVRCATLTPHQWLLVPRPCFGLAPLLPAVLARSVQEAGCLVRRLPEQRRERLRAAALCLASMGQRAGAALPAEVRWRVLALGLA